jgi:hypothetical protein
MIRNYSIWKKVVLIKSEVLSKNVSGGIEEDGEIFQLG